MLNIKNKHIHFGISKYLSISILKYKLFKQEFNDYYFTLHGSYE